MFVPIKKILSNKPYVSLLQDKFVWNIFATVVQPDAWSLTVKVVLLCLALIKASKTSTEDELSQVELCTWNEQL